MQALNNNVKTNYYVGIDSGTNLSTEELAKNISNIKTILAPYEDGTTSYSDLSAALSAKGFQLCDSPQDTITTTTTNDDKGTIYQPTIGQGDKVFSQLVPEYDEKGNIIKGKTAGKVTFISSSSPVNGDNVILYHPIDNDYTGIFKPLYLYTSIGSGGSSVGFLALPVDNKSNQTAQVIYRDIFDSKNPTTLASSGTLTGEIGNKVDYSTNSEINSLENKGYKLVSNGFPSDATYNYGLPKTYYVDFTHNIIPNTTTQTITRTINYQYDNGTQAHESVVEKADFSGKSYKDAITGNLVTLNADGSIKDEKGQVTWTPTESTLNPVNKVEIYGYHIVEINTQNSNAQINKNTGAVGEQLVTPNDNNILINIVYTPTQVSGIITYYDDTTQTTLDSATFSGNVGTKINYSTTDRIDYYESEGYKLVSSDFKNGQEIYNSNPAKNVFIVHLAREDQHAQVIYQDINNPDHPVELGRSNELSGQPGTKIDCSVEPSIKKYEDEGYVLVNNGFQNAVFDNDQNTIQTYYVTFKHGTEKTTDTKPVKETIHYVGAGNLTPKDHIQTSQWSQTITKDKVTGEVLSTSAWEVTPGQPIIYNEVISPTISGYTPNKTSIPAIQVPQNNIEYTVTYTKNMVPTQEGSLNVIFHDETTNSDLSGYGIHTGNEDVGTKVVYNPTDNLKELDYKGYEYVKTDGTIPATIVKGVTNVIIYVKHGVEKKETEKDITRTINYIDENNHEISKSVIQNAHFIQSGLLDKVTHEWITPLTWSKPQVLKEVISPTINGYHVVKVSRDAAGTNVASTTLDHSNSSYVVTVTYDKDTTPAQPDNPAEPTTPTTPTEPKKPAEPDKPETNKPVTPTTPTESKKPVKPSMSVTKTPTIPTKIPNDKWPTTPLQHAVKHMLYKNHIVTKPVSRQKVTNSKQFTNSYAQSINKKAKLPQTGSQNTTLLQSIGLAAVSLIEILEVLEFNNRKKHIN